MFFAGIELFFGLLTGLLILCVGIATMYGAVVWVRRPHPFLRFVLKWSAIMAASIAFLCWLIETNRVSFDLVAGIVLLGLIVGLPATVITFLVRSQKSRW